MPYLTVAEMKQLVTPVPCNFGRLDIPTAKAWSLMSPGQRADYLAAHAGYTYVFSASNGLHKIGCTQRLEQRIHEIRSRYRVGGKYLLALRSRNMWVIEKLLHECFADRHVKGEWFYLGTDELNQIVSIEPPEKLRITVFTAEEIADFRGWYL